MAKNALVIARLQRRQLLKIAAGGLALGAAGRFPPLGVLARGATPVASGDVTTEQLFEVTLPRSTFPLDAYFAGFCISSQQPGTSDTYSMTDHVAQTNYVLEGTLTLEQSGPGQILRKDGRIEEVGATDTVTLEAGDTRVITDLTRQQVYANTGMEPNRWTYCPIGFPTEYEIAHTGSGLVDEFCAILSDAEWAKGGLSGKGVTLRLARLTLPVDAAMEVLPDVYPVLRLMPVGRLSVGVVRLDGTEGQPYTFVQGPVPSFILGNVDHWTLTNDGDEPAVIYAYSFQPEEEGLATPVA